MSLKEQELVKIYNQAANSLLSKVVKVSVKSESITAINSNSIVLANIGYGNYWNIYEADINSSFEPVKPAKVILIFSNEQMWQLKEPGILEFL